MKCLMERIEFFETPAQLENLPNFPTNLPNLPNFVKSPLNISKYIILFPFEMSYI